MKTLLVIFDRLPYGVLGCYGNTEAKTLGFDRLAAGGVTFDLCFATAPHGGRTLDEHPLEVTRFASLGVNVRIFQQEGSAGTTFSTPTRSGVSTTTISQESGSLADCVVAAIQALPNHRQEDAGELTIVSLTGVPQACSADQLVDIKDAVTEADEVVARIFDQLQQSARGEQLLLVTAASGVPPHDADDASTDQQLRDSLIHVPLLGILHPSLCESVRCGALVTIEDVAATLWDTFGINDHSMQECRSLLPLLRGGDIEGRDEIVVIGRDGDLGFRSQQWYLLTRLEQGRGLSEQRSAAIESARLFQKPEDISDVLDVSLQAPEVVEQLVDRVIETSAAGRG